MPQSQDKVLQHINRVEHSFTSTNKKVVTTLEAIDYKNQYTRRAGNTTRQIDYAIQELFKGNIVICLDHYQVGEHRPMNEYLMRRILSRLEFEHGMGSKGAVVDKQNLTIYLK